MEKVINLKAIKSNHEERKAQKAERKAQKAEQEGEKKTIGKKIGIIGTYAAAAAAGASAAVAVITSMNKAGAPIEMETESVEIPTDSGVTEAEAVNF